MPTWIFDWMPDMQIIKKKFELGKKYSVNGVIIEAVQIATYECGMLAGTQVVYFVNDEIQFKVTRWPDGSVYRVVQWTD